MVNKKIIHKRYNSQAIVYLARLHTDNLNPLLKEAFELSKSLDSQGVYSWYNGPCFHFLV
jgi:hypothetical protein